MADEAELADIQRQLTAVDESTQQLRESITGLTVPLATLAEIQAEQRELRSQAAAVASKAEAVEVQSNTRAARSKRAAVVMLVVLGLLAGSTLWNRREIEQNNRRWCPVVSPLAPRADDPPPVGTPDQIQRSLRIRKAFAHLVEDFGCN